MASLDLTTASDASESGAWQTQHTRILCVLFFFSGFPALIYQLAWQRSLFLIFGVNIESVTIVVTAFMLGLGIGSLAGGWLSKRGDIPLLPLLATIEFLTGAFGFVSLTIFDKAGDFTIGLSLPATAIVALALVIVPTLLMGATLPVLVGHLARRSGNIGSTVGLLYYEAKVSVAVSRSSTMGNLASEKVPRMTRLATWNPEMSEHAFASRSKSTPGSGGSAS